MSLDKSIEENLNEDDTRAVADAYKEADTPELKQKVLETSGKLGDKDHILTAARMKLGGDALTEEGQDRQRRAFQEYDQAVADFMDAVKLFERMIKMARKAREHGKFSPEGARFAARRIGRLMDELEALQEELGNV